MDGAELLARFLAAGLMEGRAPPFTQDFVDYESASSARRPFLCGS
jgi:hypothetical protein